MNTLEAITTRRSVRKFLEKSVDNDQIEAIVSAASFAPFMEEHANCPVHSDHRSDGKGKDRRGNDAAI